MHEPPGRRAAAGRVDAVPGDGLPAPRRTIAWATIMVGLTLSVLDGTIASVALPTIARDFDSPASVSIWIVNGYQLAIVMMLLPLASLGEIYGYRKVYLGGITLFTLASLGCVLSDSLPMLTAARIVQGLGAAGLMSVNAAMLRYVVPQARFGAALGINALTVALAATAGPGLAGLILSVADWPWLFAINIPLGLLTLALGWRSLPESDRTDHPFDVVSAGLSAGSIGLVITTIDSIGHAVAGPLIAAQLVAAVIGFTLLVRHETRSEHPLLPLDLFRLPIFSLSVAASIGAFSAQMMAFVGLPFLFQEKMGFAPGLVGLLMMPWPAAVALVAPMAGRLSDTRSPARIGAVGMAMMATGLVLLGLLPAQPAYWDIAWRMALAGAGFGLFQSPNNRTLVGSAPKNRSGAANGMLGTARLTGQSLGAALVALLLARAGIGGSVDALFVGAGLALAAGLASLSRGRYWHRPGEREADTRPSR